MNYKIIYKDYDFYRSPFSISWEQCKVGEVSSLRGRIGFRGYTREDLVNSHEGAITFSPSDIDDEGHLSLSNNDYISFEKYEESPEIKVKVGDILFTKTASIGKVAFVKELQEKATINPQFALISPNRKINNYFQFLSMRLKPFMKKVWDITGGSSIPTMSQEKLKELSFHVPLLEEQKNISDLFSNLDNLITLHQRKQKWEFYQKSHKNYAKKLTISWEQCKFEKLFIEKREKTTTENEDTLLSCAITGMYLNSELFGAFRGSSTIGYIKVKKNDLILSAQNLHLGNANVNLRFEKGIISPAYKVFTLSECNPLFIQSWVKKDDTKNFFLAATTEGASQCRKNIEWQTLFNQTIATPKISEQKKIGNYFNKLDNLITLHQCKDFYSFNKYVRKNTPLKSHKITTTWEQCKFENKSLIFFCSSNNGT